MEGLEDFRRAGEIARKVREFARELVVVDTTALEVAEKVEAKIRSFGAEPAFPVNVSLNDVAAHYTPTAKDALSFKKGDIVKVDVGVHINGYPADTAITVDLGEHTNLVAAATDALAAALTVLKPGVEVRALGRVIEKAIKEKGFHPIVNLTGHSIDRWILHSGLSIYNFDVEGGAIPANSVIAIEPFATTGSGRVRDAGPSQIFRFIAPRQPRLPEGRKLLQLIADKYKTFPFAQRWLPNGNEYWLRQLVTNGAVHNYEVLRETGLVTQAEHTIYIGEKDFEVLT